VIADASIKHADVIVKSLLYYKDIRWLMNLWLVLACVDPQGFMHYRGSTQFVIGTWP